MGSSRAHPCHPNPDLASRFLACGRNVSEWTHTRWTLTLASTLVADYSALHVPAQSSYSAQPAQSSLVQSRCFSVPSQILIHQCNRGQAAGVVPADAPEGRGHLMQDYREADRCKSCGVYVCRGCRRVMVAFEGWSRIQHGVLTVVSHRVSSYRSHSRHRRRHATLRVWRG